MAVLGSTIRRIATLTSLQASSTRWAIVKKVDSANLTCRGISIVCYIDRLHILRAAEFRINILFVRMFRNRDFLIPLHACSHRIQSIGNDNRK